MNDFVRPKKLDQLRKIRDFALKKKLGAHSSDGCAYKHRGHFCAVGCLFNEAQLKDIKLRGLNTNGITTLSEEIGIKNIEAVTGFELQELSYLQSLHDDLGSCLQTNELDVNMFVQEIDKMIEKEQRSQKG